MAKHLTLKSLSILAGITISWTSQTAFSYADEPDLTAIANGNHRSAENIARNAFRHPTETLEFFGLKPDMTVVEIWPGGGWYTEILAPYLSQGGGTLIAAHFNPDGPHEYYKKSRLNFEAKLAENDVYKDVQLATLDPDSGPMAEPNSVDMVVTFRNLHNWLGAETADKLLKDMYDALKPGGVLGVTDHRASDTEPQDPKAASGYVREDYAIELIESVGFEFVESSPINNNAKDTKDHPFGVWTLPPSLRNAPRGEPADESFDATPYKEIGESDRFTLKFIKPVQE